MDVAAAGELLVRGQPEGLRHAPVTARADDFRLDRDRRGAQRRDPDPGPLRRGRGGRPAPADLPVQLVQRAARLGVGFQLLLRQLEIQGRAVGARRSRPPPTRPPAERQPGRFPLPLAAVLSRARRAGVPLRPRRCENSPVGHCPRIALPIRRDEPAVSGQLSRPDPGGQVAEIVELRPAEIVVAGMIVMIFVILCLFRHVWSHRAGCTHPPVRAKVFYHPEQSRYHGLRGRLPPRTPPEYGRRRITVVSCPCVARPACLPGPPGGSGAGSRGGGK